MKLKEIYIIFFFLFSSVSFSQDAVIPNIISPNNDGVNDVFFVRSTGYENLTCTIFNRYGQPIYRYFGLNGTWDAYTHAGVKVAPGTYFVLLELVVSDGTVTTQQGTLQVQY
jgi:gliding motility-associated-like protein